MKTIEDIKKDKASNETECLKEFCLIINNGKWAVQFSNLLLRLKIWSSQRCSLSWKLKISRFNRSYFKLQVATKANSLFSTVTTSDGSRGGQVVTGRYKTRPRGQVYSSTLTDLARSGLLPTPTTGNNRDNRNAIHLIGKAHQHHGAAPGLAQVLEISAGILPKEFNNWGQVPQFYNRLLPTPTVREHIGGRHPETLKLKGRNPSNSLGDTINSITGVCSRLNPLFVSEMMGFPLKWTLAPFLKTSMMGS